MSIGKADSGQSSARVNNFNQLRLILATLVIVSHSTEMIDGNRYREPLTRLTGGFTSLGDLAVDGFFAISGFLLAGSWLKSPSFERFIGRRIARIVPGFVVASLISACLFGPLGGNDHYWRQFRPFDYARSVLILDVPRLPDSFRGLKYPVVNGSLWTIHYEFLCYLGLAALGMTGLLGRRFVMLMIAGLALAIRLATMRWWEFGPTVFGETFWSYREMPRFASFFLAGSCYYLFRDKVRYGVVGALVAALATAASLRWRIPSQAILPTLGCYALFSVAFLPSRPMRWLGRMEDISYGLYLYAWPIGTLLLWYVPTIGPWWLLVATTAASAVAGWASWHLVERRWLPADRKRIAEPAG